MPTIVDWIKAYREGDTMIRKDSRLRRFGVLVIGVVCFAIAAAYLAAHPDHTWQEVTGEPEHYLTEIEIEPVRWWSIVSYFLQWCK